MNLGSLGHLQQSVAFYRPETLKEALTGEPRVENLGQATDNEPSTCVPVGGEVIDGNHPCSSL